jgi:hypothetical protein
MTSITILCPKNGFHESVELSKLNRENPTFEDLAFYLGFHYNALRDIFMNGIYFHYINQSGLFLSANAKDPIKKYHTQQILTF